MKNIIFLMIKTTLPICFFFMAINNIALAIDNDTPPFCSTRIVDQEAHTIPGAILFTGNKDFRWPNGSILKVAIDFSGTEIEQFTTISQQFSYICDIAESSRTCADKVRKTIMQQASEWSKFGNISFKYTPHWSNANIRIKLLPNKGAWSYLGKVTKPKQTMNLDVTWWNRPWILATIKHEFGHAIGVAHEQKRSDAPYVLNEQKILAYYKKANGWDEAKTRHNVLSKININSDNFLTTEYDDLSIMRYSLLREFVKNDDICPSNDALYCVEHNTKLSTLDEQGIAKFYPGKKSVPFISTLKPQHSSNKCLDITGESQRAGAKAIQYKCDPTYANQSFKFIPVEGKQQTYTIQAQHSNLCLDVEGASKDKGKNIIQWQCKNYDNQQFVLAPIDASSKIFEVQAVHSGQCLDVYGGSRDDSADIIQWPCKDTSDANQYWEIEGYRN